MVGWKRPKSVDFPSVWSTFEGKKNVGGGKRKYWIQDLSEEYKDEVVEHMINNFINDEPLTRCSKIAQDPESFEGFRSLWKDVVDQNMSLICLTKDEDGVTHLAGCNVLTVAQKDDHDQVYQGRGIQIVLGILSDVSHLKDVFSEINSDTYLSALGLYVLPEYRGEGVAVELLNAR
ncbi:hypothetical protein NQ318_004797 [Aromia moschata]|uniref:N-acetyltransferase domain-containing protein n=1 Tax=Aromia moschata TaxID=1265417 RepID=A0AAV8XRS4_9CUCU|nr:hypothetical protein NQ318_004797 [Aromia moschata]